MQIFLSYASVDRELADEIHLAMLGAGHKVFFDKESLPPGGDYQTKIRKAVADSDFFVFLISPESVKKGSFALTELGYARNKWKHPKGRVLPVMLRTIPCANIPMYLKAVTVLEPEGNVAAEVTEAIPSDASMTDGPTPPREATLPTEKKGCLNLQIRTSKFLLAIAIIVVAAALVVPALFNNWDKHTAAPTSPGVTPRMGPLLPGIQLRGGNFSQTPILVASAEECSERCRQLNSCLAMTFVTGPGHCWLKNAVPPQSQNSKMVSAIKEQ